jgi:hypothetical protein
LTGVFLDPPYKEGRAPDLYATDSLTIGDDVAQWAFEHGDDKNLRIALCGYTGEYTVPDGWTVERWKTSGGYGSQGNGAGRDNSVKETIWFSPHCERGKQMDMFGGFSGVTE